MKENPKKTDLENIAIPDINTIDGWKEIPIYECNQPLIAINDLNPNSISVESQYFKQRTPHSSPTQYVRKEAAEKLIEAANMLPSGLKILVWDAWRPLEVQKALFDKFFEELRTANPNLGESELIKLTQVYVSLPSSDPKRPSPHYTGGAIDLTLQYESGKKLFMGTDFDHFGPEAATTYFEKEGNIKNEDSKIARTNRRILYNAMTKAGFSGYHEEWWHFDFGNQFDAKRTNKPIAIYGIPPQST